MYGQGISDAGRFIVRALSALREFMDADGLSDIDHESIAPSSAKVTFAKALNRKVTGSLNELVRLATFILESEEVAPHDVGFHLNGILLTALAWKEERPYGQPREAFLRLSNPSPCR
jgi:hypothetical protein